MRVVPDESKEGLVAESAKERVRLCPNCRTELLKHGDLNPYKAGNWHCNGCGSCWVPNLKEQRAGHSGPSAAQ